MRVIATTMVSDRDNASEHAQQVVHSAADFLYAAECAFHDARQTNVDAWIKAAGNKLHDAIASHLAAVAASNPSGLTKLTN